MSPWGYIGLGVFGAVVAGFSFVMYVEVDEPLALFVASVAALVGGALLMIGTVAEGVRVGVNYAETE